MTPATYLADGNVLVALSDASHVHHPAASDWLADSGAALATCPITEGTVVRHRLRQGHTTADAVRFLDALRRREGHQFWPDGLPYDSAVVAGVIGHRQVTNAYLAALAAEQGGRVATFDRGLAALRSDAVHLISP